MKSFDSTLFIPERSPFFRGHFPGRPILPGIALLELVRRVLGEQRGADFEVSALSAMRMRRPVRGGEELSVTFSELEGEARFKFAVRAGDDAVADGVLSDAAPVAENAAAAQTESAPASTRGRSAAALLPHGDGARLVTEIIDHSAEHVHCLARIPVDSPFRDTTSRGLSPFLALEMGAQAAASHECLLAASDDEAPRPRGGYFVGAREACFGLPFLEADAEAAAEYEVRADRIGAAEPLCVYRVTVTRAGRPVLSARISTYSE